MCLNIAHTIDVYIFKAVQSQVSIQTETSKLICDAKSIVYFLHGLNICYKWFKINYIIQILAYCVKGLKYAMLVVCKFKFNQDFNEIIKVCFLLTKSFIILLIFATEVAWIKESNGNIPSIQMSQANPGTLTHLRQSTLQKKLTTESSHLKVDSKTLPHYFIPKTSDISPNTNIKIFFLP